MTGGLRISAIVPAYRAAHLLPRVLAPLIALRDAGELAEVIVVDDVSPDETAQVARDLGACVIVMARNGGPGAARNRAAREALGDILWFVDSDVIPDRRGPARIRAAMEDAEVGAVFGSYDAEPEGKSWFSRYKNLMHRYYHQRAERDARTFWAGCGAVRRDAFLAVGGFDTETYRIPSIEDIELGYRIRRSGWRIVVDPELLGKHLKVWTPRSAIHTDIFCRALPWSRLMIAREGLHDDLNTGRGERVRAVIAGALVCSVLALPFAPGLWPLALGMLALALLANLPFLRFMRAHGGSLFALKSFLYHQIYYVYSAASYLWCLFEYHILGRRDRLHVP